MDELRARFVADLKKSGLTERDAKQLGYVLLKTPPTGLTEYPAAGYTLPYYDAAGKKTSFYRYRYLDVPKARGFDALIRKSIRYIQPSGQSPRVYFATSLDWKPIIKDATVRLFITEGEKKAACASKLGIPTLGLGGVWNWQSSTEAFIPDLEQITWKDRVVYLVFDSDAATNGQVQLAENRLCASLLKKGASVYIVRIPGEFERKIGLDDFLVESGVEKFQELVYEATEFTASQHLHRMNEEVIYINRSCRILQRRTGHQFTRNDFVGAAYADWEWEEKREVPTKDGGVSTKTVVHRVAEEWIRWPYRAKVERVVYHPGKPKMYDGCFNSYNGLAVEPRKGNVKPFVTLVDHLFHRVPPAHKEWFVRWLAYPLQHLGTKLLSAVIMHGSAQGTGKTLLGTTMMKIYGSNASVVNDMRLFARFNTWAENKMFVIGDEIAGGEKRLNGDRIKSLITDTQSTIERKNHDEYAAEDFIQYYFTSNHPDPIHLDENDRRFFVHSVEFPALEQSFYIGYEEWKQSPEGPAALLDYLLGIDLGDFNPSAPPPMTAAKNSMIDTVRSDIAQWCATLKLDPNAALGPTGFSGKSLMTSQQLLLAYTGGAEVRGATAQIMSREMGRAGFRKANDGYPFFSEGAARTCWVVGGNMEALANFGPKTIGKVYAADHPTIKKKFGGVK